ncbi:MAG: hypothetical protein ACRDZW_04680, partial [Acidimicrobiales bacterium]
LAAPSTLVVGGPAALAVTVEHRLDCPAGSPFRINATPAATGEELTFFLRSLNDAQRLLGDSGALTLEVVDERMPNVDLGGLARSGLIRLFLPRIREASGEAAIFNGMVHEYFHTLQLALIAGAGGSADSFLFDPVWTHEAAANYFGHKLEKERYGTSLAAYQTAIRALSLRTPATLASLVRPSDIYNLPDFDARYATIILAGFYLAARDEEGLHTTVWVERGRTGNWQVALSNTFGLTPAEFFADFERYRRTGVLANP